MRASCRVRTPTRPGSSSEPWRRTAFGCLHHAAVARAERRGGEPVVHLTQDGRTRRARGRPPARGRRPRAERRGSRASRRRACRFDQRGVERGRPAPHQQPAHLRRRRHLLAISVHPRRRRRRRGWWWPTRSSSGLGGGRASRLVMPWATYTTPEVAHVGMYERRRDQPGTRYRPSPSRYTRWTGRSSTGRSEGFLRVHLKRGHRPHPRRHPGGRARRRPDRRDRAGDHRGRRPLEGRRRRFTPIPPRARCSARRPTPGAGRSSPPPHAGSSGRSSG